MDEVIQQKLVMSFEIVTTVFSHESAQYQYAANIIRDNTRPLNLKPAYMWFGDADNDVDGTPYWQKDPDGQAGTALLYQGKPVNGDIIPGIVVPPQIINMTPEIVLGCAGMIEYNGLAMSVVVFDKGPKSKIGEMNPAALRGIGAPAPQDGNGGIDMQSVLYRIWPGVAARLVINGTLYQFELQHS